MNVLEILNDRSRRDVHLSLGITVEEATPERVVLSMPVCDVVHQYSGILHGGVSVVLAESAASIGAAMNIDITRFTPVGIEINANHLRPVVKGVVKAVATPVYLGKTTSIWAIEIRDDRDKLVCVSRCTLAIKPGGMPGPHEPGS